MDYLFGKSAKTKTKPIFDPEQENLLNQILGGIQPGIGSGIQNLQNILGGEQEQFEAFQRPARRYFEQQTLPTIAERFTGTFGEGSQRSSAFGQALGTAGRELEENLASQRIGMQGDALSQLMKLLGPALQPRRYQYTVPGSTGALQQLLNAIAEGAGGAIGGGIPGAAIGVGKGIMKMFKGKELPAQPSELGGTTP